MKNYVAATPIIIYLKWMPLVYNIVSQCAESIFSEFAGNPVEAIIYVIKSQRLPCLQESNGFYRKHHIKVLRPPQVMTLR